MAEYIEPLQRLAEQFGRLEGIGRKTAMRLAFSVLEMSGEEAADFAQAVIDAKTKIHLCPVCQNLTDAEKCSICSDEGRDRSVICVVEDPRAVMSIEKLKIKELLERCQDPQVSEIIVATNPNVEGEATAMYLSRLLKPLGIKVTRLAYGVPVGADLEYADEVTLFRALEGRRDV